MATSGRDIILESTLDILDDFMSKLEDMVDSDCAISDVLDNTFGFCDNSRLRVLPSTLSGRTRITDSAIETPGVADQMADIAVWVNGHEKLLTGVSRITTCQNIVKTMLQDQLKVHKVSSSYAQTFALHERWRDCERPLAPRTRVYKLWKAWGNERENVKFVLKHYSANDKQSKDSLMVTEDNMDKMRKSHSRRRSTGSERHNRREHSKGLSMRKDNPESSKCKNNADDRVQRASKSDSTGSSEAELIPSAICGPDVIGQDSNANNLPKSLLNIKSEEPSTETFSQLVQLVVRQSQQLEELLDQAQSIDREIEFYETKIHLLRVEENGKNYVQDAYLANRDEDTESRMFEIIAGMSATSGSDQLETYIELYERIMNVEEALNDKKDTITALARQIEQQQSDLQSAADHERTSSSQVERPSSSDVPDDEMGLARAQLEKSAETCVAQRTELATLHKRLHVTETLLDDKCHWMRVLTAELQRLEEAERIIPSTQISATDASHEDQRLQELLQLVRQPLQPIQETSEDDTDDMYLTHESIHIVDKKLIADDSSSDDTGLSSLHSQDEQDQYLFDIISETLV